MTSLSYIEFQKKQFPEDSAFHRRHLDVFTNLVKWFAVRAGYLCFRMKISGNMIDAVGFFLSLAGFLFLSTVLSGEKALPLIGILLIYFHVFTDFMDGTVPKADDTCTVIGEHLDDIGCDVDRCALLILLGIFTQSVSMMIANVFSACVSVFFIPYAHLEMPKKGWIGSFCRFYVHKYSFLSVRIMLGALPLLLMIAILFDWNLSAISWSLSGFYAFTTVLWLLLCVPTRQER